MKLFYISFATEIEFLGATVVKANDEFSALDEATNRGLNPGGQAAILEVPEAAINHPDQKKMLNRLMSKQDMINEVPFKRHGDLDNELRYIVESKAVSYDQ